jgi:hypothetical protein
MTDTVPAPVDTAVDTAVEVSTKKSKKSEPAVAGTASTYEGSPPKVENTVNGFVVIDR